jgi:hypothetical protein
VLSHLQLWYLPGGQSSMFYSIDGGRSRTSSSSTSSQGAHHQHFTALMVGAPRPPALAPPPKGRTSMFYNVDGGHSRTSSSDTSQGGPSSMFYSVDGGCSRTSSYGTTSKGTNAPHTFGADGYVCMGQQVVSPHI